jgi:hypothetical protein
MKLIKLIGHPVTVVCMFCLLLISGKSIGGFYLLYILLGLPHGALHAILAVTGITLMVTGYKLPNQSAKILKPVLYFLSLALMVVALTTFFANSKGYNDSTFHQTVPLGTFVLFGVCVLCNLFLAASYFVPGNRSKDKTLSIAP